MSCFQFSLASLTPTNIGKFLVCLQMFVRSCLVSSLKPATLVFLSVGLGRRTAGEAPDGWVFELPLLLPPVWVEVELPLAE